ncbi:MAG TPA: acetyl-CoA decarbonylase/synthase complex subunit delta, partial [Syntrophales bacterium]|nr:acetyl-CoA decarbonylase/synthase complex subunit delta [Syntrophales bacterium]
PNHVCIITPERLGLCGAYNWLDGKAAYEINETGPNQPVKKGEVIDPVKGVFQGINAYVYTNSHKAVTEFCCYSLMDRPMTSCGCFEAILAYLPECNGIMVVNREYQGETPVGMSFSSLAGNVGGGQQTPGFMGVGKVFLTSKKFLAAEGGFKRLVWMPKALKELLAPDLQKRFTEQGAPDLLDKIADEDIGVDAHTIRQYMEKVGHPALNMEDMAVFSMPTTSSTTTPAPTPTATADIVFTSPPFFPPLVGGTEGGGKTSTEDAAVTPPAVNVLNAVTCFPVRYEKCEVPIWQVTLGATKKTGGTRGHTLTIGGADCMPFHLWEGRMPNRPVVAMEVFDVIAEKYPAVLRNIYGDLLYRPAEMARVCVEKYGADLISIRLDGTHPEKGNRTPDEAVKLVKEVLAAVDVPLIITGQSHYETNNEVLKAVAQACAGENLLLNWVEQNNYRTIAGAAIAYGHCVVAQSPIDVNIGKQMNILLTNMDFNPERIVMDPMTGATGYGIEYTYSVMERIRLTGLGGDKLLAAPMIVSPGYECARIKEYRAQEADFPAWGNLEKRAALWELTTALSLLYAGADLLIMYHPEAAMALKKTIMDFIQ